MAEPFKNFIHPEGIRELGARILAVYPAFPLEPFVAASVAGLEPLALKARVEQVATALRQALPLDWAAAVDVLVRSLPAALPGEEGVSSGFSLWPVLTVVERHGAHDPAVSLPALREMTRRFSAEFAIRPLILHAPDPTWAALARWVHDPDVHVRRLVSEGSRPRLPWGQRLPADPRALPLLTQLRDDPSPYVRRSVANHLGDLAKIDPEATLTLTAAWLAEPAPTAEIASLRRDLVRHALRDLLKRGHAGALSLVGFPPVEVEVSSLRVLDTKVGEPAEISAQIVARAAAHVRVDYVWSWPGARGGWASKTFRGDDRRLEAGESWAFRARISTRPVSTRPTRPGPQRLTLRVLGQDFGPVDWVLRE